jgi:hypothetical protein
MKKDIRNYISDNVEVSEDFDSDQMVDPISEAYMNEADVNIGLLSAINLKENAGQIKAVTVLKALAESDEDLANEFMEKLSDKFTEVAEDIGI